MTRQEQGRGRRSAQDELAAAVALLRHPGTAPSTAELDAAASRLSADERQWASLSRALLAVSTPLLVSLWHRGWQPDDLLRAVRKELGPAHLRLTALLVAAESLRYPAAHLPPHWTAQLRELDAPQPWPGDDAFLSGWTTAERLDRFGAAGAVLELLRLVCRLPPLELLAPPPGAAAAPGTPPPGGGAGLPLPGDARARRRGDTRLLGRVRALLAKAESTGYGPEAEALSAKAQWLMTEHNLSEALLDCRLGGGEAPAGRRLTVEGPYEQARALLLDAVASANRCRSVWSEDLGFATVIGYPPDLASVELLYTSLLVQAGTALREEADRRTATRGSRSRAFRRSFLVGYAARVGERLRAAESEAAAAAGGVADGSHGSALLPVLAARHRAVDDAMAQVFPRLTTSRARQARHAEGLDRGRVAADRAGLGRGRDALPDG